MTWYSKVAWSQGMFIQPQHFQQHTRYIENLVRHRTDSLAPYDWGIKELSIDRSLLPQGKIAIEQCSGRFEDGTPFEFSQGDDSITVLDVPVLQDAIVYLTLPLRRTGMQEIETDLSQEGLVRYLAKEEQVRDSISSGNTEAMIQTAELNVQLNLDTANLGDFSIIPIAHIIERQKDGKITLDEYFVPPSLSCKAAPQIQHYIEEVQKLLNHRAETLAVRISDGGKGASGSSEMADFLLLQTINRYEPLLHHLVNTENIHPQNLYQLFLQLAGELTTFTKQSRRPSAYPQYQHNNLHKTFTPVLAELRKSLSVVLEQSATQLDVQQTEQQKKFGIFVSPIKDRSQVGNAYFILAAKASMNSDDLRRHLPQQLKIGPVEMIRDLVNSGLPGISLRALPAAPRQIPFHSGFTYFELDKNSDLWGQFQQSGGFAIHVGGDYPGLEIEFWSVKE